VLLMTEFVMIRTRDEGWLDVERAAVVEMTSEDKDFPVEAAFASGDARGWRAAAPGTQTIRLIFDQPQKLKYISLVFEENRDPAHARVRSAMVAGRRELAQRNCASAVEFQPTRAIRELEEYQVELSNVAVLELVIKPNIGGGLARASLKNLRLS
jgi:hypothetical protein